MVAEVGFRGEAFSNFSNSRGTNSFIGELSTGSACSTPQQYFAGTHFEI